MWNDRNKNLFLKIIGNRFMYIVLFVLFVVTAMIVRLYNITIVHGDEYKKKSDNIIGTTVTINVDTPRGSIYDRNGVLLATTRTSYKVYMTNVTLPQSMRDSMYLSIIKLFETNNDIYNNNLKRYITPAFEWGSSLSGDDNTEARTNWINKIVVKRSDRNSILTAKDAFDYMRNKLFKLDESYTDADAYRIMIIRYDTYRYGLSKINPMVLATDCSSATMEYLESRYFDFPGVTTAPVYYREYVDSIEASHILGYVRAISSDEYEILKDQGYSNDDIIGKTGIEKAAESVLRGIKGSTIVYLDDEDNVRELSHTDPVPGDDIYLTIDYSFQQKCVGILESNIKRIAALANGTNNFGDANAGSIVVMSPKTGEVLAMANYPNYDNSIFVRPSSDKAAQQAITDLFLDKSSPSLNRATQGLYPIGSTFKPIVAISALTDNVITTSTEIDCNGYIEVNNKIHKCMSIHGNISLYKAIAKSCNAYFQTVGIMTGIDSIDMWAKSFGLGELTGIEISEYRGYRNNVETMKVKETDIYHKWTDSDTAQASIGQLYNLFTPLQLCNYTCALGNGGKLYTPYLIKSAISYDGNITLDELSKRKYTKIDVDNWILEAVKTGMIEMADTNNTAKENFAGFPAGFIAAKTGTPETGLEAFGQSSHSLFICYAPANDPEIAISIVIEHGASGGNSIPIAAEVLKAYFSDFMVDVLERASKGGYGWRSLI